MNTKQLKFLNESALQMIADSKQSENQPMFITSAENSASGMIVLPLTGTISLYAEYFDTAKPDMLVLFQSGIPVEFGTSATDYNVNSGDYMYYSFNSNTTANHIAVYYNYK